MGVSRAQRALRARGSAHPHRLSASRIAQLHRWQMLGAAARRGSHRASRDIHFAQTAKARSRVAPGALRAAAWTIGKTVLPTQMVAPLIPGYQPGDRTYKPLRRR
jgi:hypothetical protein